MIRVRFIVEAAEDDYRPVKFPPPGPYWCTGWAPNGTIIVAYLETEDQIKEYWPDVIEISFIQEREDITFTDRFPKPDWWNEKEPLQ